MVKLTQGLFIAVEGIDGVGKSAAVAYLHRLLLSYGINVLLSREPGGTELAEQIRALLLNHHQEQVLPDTELLLLFAARVQHTAHVIRPALNSGRWVLSDRFIDSSYAYQGGGRGVPMARIKTLEEWFCSTVLPNHVFILDAPVSVALSRKQQDAPHDRIEKEQHAFFERVRQAYADRAAENPTHYSLIDSSMTLEHVQAQLKAKMHAIIEHYNELV